MESIEKHSHELLRTAMCVIKRNEIQRNVLYPIQMLRFIILMERDPSNGRNSFVLKWHLTLTHLQKTYANNEFNNIQTEYSN